ncbi:PAP2 superfamily protein [Duganella sp. CF402]|uniref:phosphatase PAP2 family protein n=1 Tax=unclassified Duganella TaxID=2636909 RepID=UPI0008BE1A42|nr:MULTISPECIES: phosphatase PAP2 family protein [unclassified Duganella]RZT10104.1 PAP2 superfamily protein [Duganella sp. BK701]SEL28275.1 PAP2 superfamily protein [Duganella sp. CF402]
MMMWWHWLSVIGSLAVTGPIGVAIVVWLLAGKSWRLTAIWLVLFGAGMALVVATKMAFIGWGIGVASVEFAGFSGHAMRAAAVFPVAGFLATRSTSQTMHWLGTAAGVLLAVLIAMSRVYVRAHSQSEAVTGCVLGLLVAGIFIWYASTEHHMALSRLLVMLCIPVLLVAPRVEPIPAEQWITKAALYLSGRDQPYTRQMWRKPRFPLD